MTRICSAALLVMSFAGCAGMSGMTSGSSDAERIETYDHLNSTGYP